MQPIPQRLLEELEVVELEELDEELLEELGEEELEELLELYCSEEEEEVVLPALSLLELLDNELELDEIDELELDEIDELELDELE